MTITRSRVISSIRQRGGAEQEGLSGSGLVDHLLVELADAPPVGQDDGVEAAVGDGAGVGDGEPACALARADDAGDAVPDDACAQLGELLGGIAPVEHVEHVLEQRAGEGRVGVRAGGKRVEIVDAHSVIGLRPPGRGTGGCDGDDLLGEHVERVAGDDGGLDQPFVHALGDDGALEQVAAELGEDAPAGDLFDAVPGAADALQPAGDGLGRLDLDDEVDGAHVDAELERAGGDEAWQLAGLEQLLDVGALLARERAVVGAGDFDRLGVLAVAAGALRGELVEAQRNALGGAAVVDEHDRGGVLAHEVQQLGVDGGPDRASRGLAAGERLERIRLHPVDRQLAAGLRVGFGSSTRRAPRCAGRAAFCTPASTIVTCRLGPTRKRPISSSGLWVALRPIRCIDLPVPSTWAASRSSVSARCAPRFECGDGVDLVDDHGLDAAEHLARTRGEDQVQRLGCGDEDVWRLARHCGALALGRVAGADADGHVLGADAAQWHAQVALDVVGERLQRADVHHARAARARRVAALRRRSSQRSSAHRNAASVLPDPVGADTSTCSPARDRRPRLRLGGRGRGERPLEPLVRPAPKLRCLRNLLRRSCLRLHAQRTLADRSSGARRGRCPRRAPL